MASPLFARHCPDEPSDAELNLIRLAAASAAPDRISESYTSHVKLAETIRERQGSSSWLNCEIRRSQSTTDEVVAAARQLFNGDEPEARRWEALMMALGDSRCDEVILTADGSTLHVTFLDSILAGAYVCSGKTYPQALCAAMLDRGVTAVRMAPNVDITLLGVLEACGAFFEKQGNGESAAAFQMILADALYLAGRTRDAAQNVVAAIERSPKDPYPWAVLCELLKEQDPGTFVNVRGVGHVDAAVAAQGLETALATQRVGGLIRWPVVAAIAVGVLGAGVLAARLWARRRR